ncbi:MAG: hypothetical protein AB1486_27245 [Planctomycetota bacterium]
MSGDTIMSAETPAEPARKKRRKKSFIRSGLIVLIVLTLGVLFVSAEFLSGGLISWALSTTVTEATGARVEIEQSDASLLNANLSFEKVDLFPYFETKEALFHGEKAFASLDLGAALSGRIWIPELSLTGGIVTLKRDENGRLNIDPGDPPAGAEPDPEAGPPFELPEGADIIQQIGDLIDRLQRYKGYYDKVKREKQQKAAEEKARERVYPGQASYLVKSAEALEPRLWIKRIEASNLRVVTHDARTGKPFLPFDSISLLIENLTEDSQLTRQPIVYSLAAQTLDAGNWSIRYATAVQGAAKTPLDQMSFSLSAVPFEKVASLVSESLPFRLAGGTLDLETIDRKGATAGEAKAAAAPLRIGLDKVRGAVRLSLNGAKLLEARGGGDILGLPAGTFTELFNYALTAAPLKLVFSVDGRPSRPQIQLLNGKKLLQTLRDRATGAAEEKVRALANLVTAEAQARAEQGLQQAKDLSKGVLDDADELLDDKAAGLLEGTPLKKLGDEKTKKLKGQGGDTVEEATDKASEKAGDLLDKGKGKLDSLFGKDKKDEKDKKDAKEKKDTKKDDQPAPGTKKAPETGKDKKQGQGGG